MSLNKVLLDILVCPKCKGELEYQESESQLICYTCSLVFIIKNDIPVMLIEEAKGLKQ